MSIKRWLPAVLAVAAVQQAAPANAAPQYEVGVAKSDITWHVDSGSPQSPFLTFSGLHTRLWAKAIVIRPPDARPFALVRTDTLLITSDLYEGVLQRVARLTGIDPDRILLAATHTHTGNNGLYPHAVHSALYRSFDPREREFLADRIAQAVATAAATTRPATLAAGSTRLGFAEFNRRYTENEQEHRPPFANDPSRLDPEIGVLRFDDARTHRPIAVVMNHGVHPVVTINEPLLSSDLVGYAERALERSFRGARPMAIWFTGAQGDQDPIHVRYSYPEAEFAGDVLGRAAGRVAVRLRPAPITSARITGKLIPLPAPGGPSPSLGVEGVGRVPVEGPSPVTVPSSVRLQVVELGSAAGGRTALMSWPGEPIRDIGVALKAQAHALGFDRAYVLALADDWAGYWLTPAEYDRQRYEWTLMFYGRESAPYVENNVVDLVRSLATGSTPTAVPLPPEAVADRQFVRASAASGAPALPDPPQDPEPALSEQPPQTIARGAVVRVAWVGGSPAVSRDWFPHVTVERAVAGAWEPVAHEGTGAVLLRHEGSSTWSARWQPTIGTPTGTYRMRIEGNRQGTAEIEPYALVSRPFGVTACACVRAGTLQAQGRRLSLEALYAAWPKDGFRLLPDRVRGGMAVVRVLRGGEEIGRVRLRYRPHHESVARTVQVNDLSGKVLPVTTRIPEDRGVFAGRRRGPLRGVRFELASVTDAYGNR